METSLTSTFGTFNPQRRFEHNDDSSLLFLAVLSLPLTPSQQENEDVKVKQHSHFHLHLLHPRRL